MAIVARRIVPAMAILLLGLSTASPRADELGEQYRQATDGQRTAYIEAVLSQTRFKSEPPHRLKALVAFGRACIDDWDPKLEPKFLDQVASCLVMANRRVKADP